MRKARVVSHSIGRVLGEVVVVVEVECPNGCRAGRGGARPKLHSHGWTRLQGKDGGERAAHCHDVGAPGYRLHWPGGVPTEVSVALGGRHARQA